MNPSEPTPGGPSIPPRSSSHLSLDDAAAIETFRPRNRRRKRRGLRSTVVYRLRLGVMAVGGIFAAYVAFLLIQKILHPYRLSHEVGGQVAVLRGRLDRENTENTALRERILFLRTKEGAEVTARRAGYHKKGETVYLLPLTPDSPTAPVASP